MKKTLFYAAISAMVAVFLIIIPVNAETPEFDPDGVYNAYLGVQMNNWYHRNAWACNSMGANGSDWEKYDDNYFYNIFHGDTGGPMPGVLTDTEINGNGTYRVSLTDYDFGGADAFNQLFVSTNIPLEGNNLSFTDVKVIIGGRERHVFDEGYVYGIDNNDQKDYYEIYCINAWNRDLQGLFNDTVPESGEIAIEFTVSGFNHGNAVEPEAVEPEADEPEDEVPDNENAHDNQATAAEPLTPAVNTGDNSDSAGTGFPVLVIPAAIVGVIIIVLLVVLLIAKKNK